MKKLYVTLLSALVAGGASAQTLSNDRMVVTNSIGQTTSYAVDRIQSVTFPQAAGEAAVDLSVNSVDQDKAVLPPLVTLMLCLLSLTFLPRQERA